MNIREIKHRAHCLIIETLNNDTPEVIDGDDGEKIESYYLGSVMSLYPSGKFYTPWACSNVNSCPRCKGEGCNYCGQLGSREAYEDDIFSEALDKTASKHGCYITSGEGDLTDLLLQRIIEEEQKDESYN